HPRLQVQLARPQRRALRCRTPGTGHRRRTLLPAVPDLSGGFAAFPAHAPGRFQRRAAGRRLVPVPARHAAGRGVFRPARRRAAGCAGSPVCGGSPMSTERRVDISVDKAAPLSTLPLGPLERGLLASLQRLEPQADAVVLACAALCSEALAAGDVCLPLARVAGRRPWPEHDFAMPPLAELRTLLEASALVGAPGRFAPLILDGERLYLARY